MERFGLITIFANIVVLLQPLFSKVSLPFIRFLKSDFCFTIPDKHCPKFLEAVLREGIPVLAEADDVEMYPQVSILRILLKQDTALLSNVR